MSAPGEWIEWKGGECSPVGASRKVEVRKRSGAVMDFDPSYDSWEHDETDPEGDIIAYRVVNP